jgi:hypothetical protein
MKTVAAAEQAEGPAFTAVFAVLLVGGITGAFLASELTFRRKGGSYRGSGGDSAYGRTGGGVQLRRF